MNRKRYIEPKSRAKNPLKFRVLNKHLLEIDECVGRCWPGTKKHIIEIDPRQSPKEYLDTLIHEALHELLPKKREDFILRAATSIANLLWKMGYRRNKKSSKS